MVLRHFSLPHSALVITDASIKKDIAMSISHIHSANQPLIKTVHHASFVTSTEAELFAIRCGINQACSINNVSKIIIITALFMWQRKFSIARHILSKFILLQSFANCKSSAQILTIPSNSGNAQAVSNRGFTMMSIKIPNLS